MDHMQKPLVQNASPSLQSTGRCKEIDINLPAEAPPEAAAEAAAPAAAAAAAAHRALSMTLHSTEANADHFTHVETLAACGVIRMSMQQILMSTLPIANHIHVSILVATKRQSFQFWTKEKKWGAMAGQQASCNMKFVQRARTSGGATRCSSRSS